MSIRKAAPANGVTKRFAQETFRLACTDPYLWMEKAKEVRRAAEVLWKCFLDEISKFTKGDTVPEPFFGQTVMMLYGLVVENLLKAVLVKKGVALTKSGQFALRSHNLQQLTCDAGLRISAAEAELLERLQLFVEWAGRYPIPLQEENLYPRQMVDGGGGALHGISTADRGKVVKLVERIETLLPDEEQAVVNYVRSYRV